MKAKLIKFNDNKLDGGFYILRDLNGNPIALEGNLSLKNCQAIERGYDLNELGMDYASTIYDGRTELTRFNGAKVDFIKGFQKALELMGDKKFSEEDIKKVIFLCCNDEDSTEETIFESLQQTEWDVEIEMGGYRLNDDGEIIGFPSYELPKLDADGCLILKRINL